MRNLVIVTAGIWVDGIGTGIAIGLMISSHIEGRGAWQYWPILLLMVIVLVVFVIMYRRAMQTVNSGRV